MPKITGISKGIEEVWNDGEHRFDVVHKDGRILSIPYTWFPRLIGASAELLKHPEHLPFNATESAA